MPVVRSTVNRMADSSTDEELAIDGPRGTPPPTFLEALLIKDLETIVLKELRNYSF